MKRIAIAAIALLASFSAEAQKVKIIGKTSKDYIGKIYLQKFNNKLFDMVDSSTVSNGEFKFEKTLELPELYGLSFDKDDTPYYIFLQEGEVAVELSREAGYRGSKTEGSALQKQFHDFQAQGNADITSYIKENPSSLVTAYILYRNYSYRLTPEEIRANVALLDKKLHSTPYVKILLDFANTLETVGVGSIAPDFAAATPEGKTLSMKEALAGKRYLLIDFWASWCKPCRKENPNVVKAFADYHEKGFGILGVSLDKAYDPWVKAIKDDALTWQHVSDLKYWASEPAEAYGIRVVPSNVLVDSEGRIVARNLRGQDLQDALSQLFNK